MPVSIPVREYLLNALNHTQQTVVSLLGSMAGESSLWETRLAAERFSLREIVAHLADWESVFRDRYERMVNEERPLLLRPDLDERALEKGYATADPVDNLLRFSRERAGTIAWLRSLPDAAWDAHGELDRMGEISLIVLLSLNLAHDSYHLRQIAEWLSVSSSR